jgi:hypothetical protein
MIATLLTGLVLAPISLSVRVDGPGYLRFVRDGRIVYAASANLIAKDGVLSTATGEAITPAIRIPASAAKLTIDLQGNVTAGSTTAGRLVLAMFDAPLQREGQFLISAARAKLANPGEGAAGVIRCEGAGNAGGSALVRIHGLTELSQDSYTLGDVADIEGDTKSTLSSISLGIAPPVGIDMAITAARVKALAKKAGIDVQIEMPALAIVRRKAQEIPSQSFVDFAIKTARETIGGSVPLAGIDHQPPFKAPLGQVELKPEGVATTGNTVSVTVAVYVDSKRVNARVVSLKPDGSAEVKPGMAVKVLMKSAGLTVEINGKARTGGVVGQTITVVTDTGSVVVGTIVSGGSVEVKM